MKKLAVLFPGLGYTCDKPLLYYTEKLLKKYEYDIVKIDYSSLCDEPLMKSAREHTLALELASKKLVIDFVAKAAELCAEQMKRVDTENYETVVFAGKSIGCMVASLYAQKNNICPKYIMLTPLEFAFQFVNNTEGIAFVGTADKLVNADQIKAFCKEKKFLCYRYEGCNHSLENEDVLHNLDRLSDCMKKIDGYIGSLEKCVYDFKVNDRKQNEIKLSQYKDKVLLIVNTATGCGFTPQYHALEQLQKDYEKQGFTVLDFPCNQFANQAPGSSDEIYSFCTSRYDISFPQFGKLEVNGDNQAPIYEYLKSRKGFEGFDATPDGSFLTHKLESECPGYEESSDIKWNFTKFLINRKGQVVERYEPSASFDRIKADIEREIGTI